MFKSLSLFAACLIGSHLQAESIENTQFEFPSSHYDWNLLLDHTLDHLFEDEDDDENDTFQMKVYTHREGDALEFFFAVSVTCSADGDEEEEVDTREIVQSEINSLLNRFLPNHYLYVTNFSENHENGVFEWEFTDGSVDLVHGSSRGAFHTSQGVETSHILCYITTAQKTAENQKIWADFLENNLQKLNSR